MPSHDRAHLRRSLVRGELYDEQAIMLQEKKEAQRQLGGDIQSA